MKVSLVKYEKDNTQRKRFFKQVDIQAGAELIAILLEVINNESTGWAKKLFSPLYLVGKEVFFKF